MKKNTIGLFEDSSYRRGYLSPHKFHEFMNQVAGMKIGLNRVYEELASGKIYALRTGIHEGSYQIPLSEAVAADGGAGAYELRCLAESQGRIPAPVGGLLGNRKQTTLNE